MSSPDRRSRIWSFESDRPRFVPAVSTCWQAEQVCYDSGVQVMLSIAEYGRREADGTLTLLHMGLDEFRIMDPDATTYQMFAYVVFLVSFEIGDAGVHDLRVVVVDGNGANVIPEFQRTATIAGRFSVESAVLPLAHSFDPGDYENRLLWDGEQKFAYPMTVGRGEDPGTDTAGGGSRP